MCEAISRAAAKGLARGAIAVFALGLLAGFAPRALAAEKAKIAVLQLNARGLDEDVVSSVTDLVVRQVDRSGLFETISMDDIRALLQHAEKKAMLGCDDTSCLVEIGGALGAELLLSGSVGKIGRTYVISLRLIDVTRSKVVSREEKTVQGEVDDLIQASRMAVEALLRPMLKKAAGSLIIGCNEEGAEVYVDDLMVGTTPMDARQVPGGYHAIRVTKKSFVAYAKDVLISPDRQTRLEVTLIPSPEFIAAYRSRAKTERALAWTFTALAVAAAGSAAGLIVWNEGRLGDYEQDRKRYLEEGIGDGYALNDRADSINLVDDLAWAAGGVGLASLACGIYFFVAGDPPDRYDHLRTETKVESAFDLQPTAGPGGVGATATLRF